MNIMSDFERDIRTQKCTSGAYEWWYFDAISDDGNIQIVVIFYEGNPFSRRYINARTKDENPLAETFPAISISVYRQNEPVFYSFTEVTPKDASFASEALKIRIGEHEMIGRREEGKIQFNLKLKEHLPSGDAIHADLSFKSTEIASDLFTNSEKAGSGHSWNVIQPSAHVSGHIKCSTTDDVLFDAHFKGKGYHDHNIGKEPLEQEFEEWYWGRFHFTNSSLIYYVINDNPEKAHGWLIGADNQTIVETFDTIRMEDDQRSLFGLHSARKLLLKGASAEVTVQQTHLIDNGPFYQRFNSNAFLHGNENNALESSKGITEFICPPRIYNRLFWPIVNMRIRYQKESPHWVQRSSRLYRWTW